MGGMHGDLADELNEICDVESYDGLSADAPLIISREDGFSTDENTAAVVRKFLDAGMSVGLEHADEREINDFLRLSPILCKPRRSRRIYLRQTEGYI